MHKTKTTKNISIYDISKNIGIAPSTVSRVLNGHANISESVTKEVIKVSRSMGFVSNKKIQTVGIIVGEMSRFAPVGYTGMLTVYLAKQLKKLGLVMELIDEDDLEYVKLISYAVVIGIVFNEDSLIKLQEFNLPVITINYPMCKYGFHSVCVNHFNQTFLAAEYLFDNGHKNITFLEGRRHNWGSRERLSGFKKAHEKRGLLWDDRLIQYNTEKPLHEIVETILKLEATAIINCSEETALELPYYLQTILKKNIPEEISLITIGVNPVQKYMTPSQTEIVQPFKEMCKLIVEKVQDIINGDIEEILNVVFESELIKRDSVKKNE